MARPFKCPYCSATETVSKGVRKTKTMGDRRLRLCKACRRKFTPKNQTPPEAAPVQTAPPVEDKSRPSEEEVETTSSQEPGAPPVTDGKRPQPEWTS